MLHSFQIFQVERRLFINFRFEERREKMKEEIEKCIEGVKKIVPSIKECYINM